MLVCLGLAKGLISKLIVDSCADKLKTESLLELKLVVEAAFCELRPGRLGVLVFSLSQLWSNLKLSADATD